MYSDFLNKYISRFTDEGIIQTETQRIEALNILKELTEDADCVDSLSFDIVIKNKTAYLLCKFTDGYGYICKGGVKIDSNIGETLSYLMDSIIKGQHAIQVLNEALSNTQASNGIILSLRYRWGFGKTSSIAYWDYTNIVIRMSENTIQELISNKTLDEIENSIKNSVADFKWSDSITEFISTYNESSICKTLNSVLDYDSIAEALQDNMLSQEDIESTINKNKEAHSSQKLKSVHFVSELGLFAAILLWEIDYDLRDIRISILEDTVIDLENNRFVSDHSLYSRIEQKILGEAYQLTDGFKA